MPFKSILVALTGFNSDRSVLDTAVALARPAAAHIHCLHTRIDVSQSADFIGASARKGDVLFELTRKIAEEERILSRHAKDAFHDAVKRHALLIAERPEQATGISVAWREAVTLEDETLAEARYHDITVMGRDRELSGEGIRAVLLRSGRPLLLAPAMPVQSLGHHVAIAWKETPEAARAVTAAMPLILAAKKVTVICVAGSQAKGDADRQAATGLARELAWHGIEAQVHIEYRTNLPEDETLRGACSACGADLLVMGGYGHSRAREMVFGGMTEGMLSGCGIPVFMFH